MNFLIRAIYVSIFSFWDSCIYFSKVCKVSSNYDSANSNFYSLAYFVADIKEGIFVSKSN